MAPARKPPVPEEYARGQRDGLRLALAILAGEEAKWAALLGESPSWRTNAIREVRHKTLQVAQRRVRTALGRLAPKTGDAVDPELAAALEQAGLRSGALAADALAWRRASGNQRAMTASELQDLVVRTLTRAFGTQRRWRIVVGPVRLHDLTTPPHCNWSVDPSGTPREVTQVERLLHQVRFDHPIVSAG